MEHSPVHDIEIIQGHQKAGVTGERHDLGRGRAPGNLEGIVFVNPVHRCIYKPTAEKE